MFAPPMVNIQIPGSIEFNLVRLRKFQCIRPSSNEVCEDDIAFAYCERVGSILDCCVVNGNTAKNAEGGG
jgi:hypothetical protein